jgi:hypothetical protein
MINIGTITAGTNHFRLTETEERGMNGYISAKEAAERWDITMRQVQKLCKEGRIEGVTTFSDSWAIPEDAPKPTRTGKLKPGRKPKINDRQQ